jgi:hypothetical protein
MTAQSVQPTDQHDDACPPFYHATPKLAGPQKEAFHIHSQDRVEVSLADICRRRDARLACTADKAGYGAVTNVRNELSRLGADRSQFAHGFVDAFAGHIKDRDAGPLLRQLPRAGSTESRGAAGNAEHFVLESVLDHRGEPCRWGKIDVCSFPPTSARASHRLMG